MTVAELIAVLKQYPENLNVVYKCYSEHEILSGEDIFVKDLCLPRDDGWVQNKRPDKPYQTYLVLPGN